LPKLKIEKFTSLGLTERFLLFLYLCSIHALGVEHADFEPRNVVRKGWRRLRVIDFAFSDVNHTCSGWGVCNELTHA